MFTVYYEVENTAFNYRHYQNENRTVRARGFKSVEEAKTFANEVNAVKIVNPMGKVVEKF